MSNNVRITSDGIKKVLRYYNAKSAIAEYIWNGFDARASTVRLNYKCNKLGALDSIEVIDNGVGIDLDKLSDKFNPFYDSEKTIDISAPKHTSLMHGKNGVGRLTFFKFAAAAEWVTTFKNKTKCESGSIQINIDGLNSYSEKIFQLPLNGETGTKVEFRSIKIEKNDIENDIIPFLISEFCWFLELNKKKGYQILINNRPLNYDSNIQDHEDSIEFIYTESNTKFEIKYVQWVESLNKEFSKHYFLNSDGNEVFKDYTTLNKKGDQFYHSVFIKSDFFNSFDFNSSENDGQISLFGKAKSSPEYKFLLKEINKYLRAKRKPFLKLYASKLVAQYEKDGIFPTYKSEWEKQFKKPQLEETIIGLYEVQPQLFNNLSVDQKKTFVRFLDLLLDTNERENVFKILEEIIDLDSKEREDLASLFKTTRLNRIVETLKLIEDRYATYYKLKELVFNPDLKANEVDHLQKLVENHYWIFGEQYHLVTAADPKFEEALRRYVFHLTGKTISKKIDHPHKLKEMDIFACRQNKQIDRIENIIIELKHPKVLLGEEHYSQVHKYLQVISSQPDFNASNMCWEFYLIGNKFNTSNYIDDLINTNKNHGISSLILWKNDGKIKVYAKKWSEIFADFEIKHKFLDEKLKLKRDLLINQLKTADEVVESVQDNSAVQPKEVKIVDQ